MDDIVLDMYNNQYRKNPTQYTINDFSPEYINQVRQNIVNREYDINNRLNELKEMYTRYNNREVPYPYNLYDKDKYDMNKLANREFSYENYGSGNYKDPFELTIKETLELMGNKDPRFEVGSTLGSARYSIDNNGNVILNDRYDFNKKLGMNNLPADMLHKLGAMFGTPYDVSINLGNINDWGLGYTGNRLLDAYYTSKRSR